MYYGYGYGYGYSSSIGYGSKKGSVSGWERSHFGGYYRVLSDYPHITTNFGMDIVTDNSLGSLGKWNAEKLIKLYLLKLNEITPTSSLKGEIIKTKNWLGQEKKSYVVSLNDKSLFTKVCSKNTELAPMFENYKEGILLSRVEVEIQDDKKGSESEGGKNPEGDEEKQNQGGTGKGDNEGSEENKNETQSEEGEGDSEGEGEKGEEENKDGKGEGGNSEGTASLKTKSGFNLENVLNDIKEFKREAIGENRSLTSFDEEAKFVSLPGNKRTPYNFSSEEIKNSEHLIKLLDISFDPKSEIVKNLKVGKLDVSKIAEVPAGNLSIYKREMEDQDTQPFTVCILADMSGSMTSGRTQPQLIVLNSLYLAMSQILPEDKLYIYGHTGEYTPDIYTFYSPYDTNYEKNIRSYHDVYWCQNYDGPVVEAIHKKVRERTDDRVIFITLSDGEPYGYDYGSTNDYKEFKKILERARRDSFVTVGIGIQSNHVKSLYTYSKSVDNLANLAKDVSSIVNQVVRAEFK